MCSSDLVIVGRSSGSTVNDVLELADPYAEARVMGPLVANSGTEVTTRTAVSDVSVAWVPLRPRRGTCCRAG